MTMDQVSTIRDLRAAMAAIRAGGKSVGFVPTMGALHAGHCSLIDAARAECDVVVVSIFVNPTQFAPGEDLSVYPRPIEADLTACQERGVAVVFTPTQEEMYPPREAASAPMTASISRLADALCGRSRPTHFAGVCTVVAKLLNQVQPDVLYLGQKDFQQAAILKQMIADLNFSVRVNVCPIVREVSGLALSSRNVYLDEKIRKNQAPQLHQLLQRLSKKILESSPSVAQLRAEADEFLAANAPDFQLDYLEFVDSETLIGPVNKGRNGLVAIAGRFGQTRLIDNVLVVRE